MLSVRPGTWHAATADPRRQWRRQKAPTQDSRHQVKRVLCFSRCHVRRCTVRGSLRIFNKKYLHRCRCACHGMSVNEFISCGNRCAQVLCSVSRSASTATAAVTVRYGYELIVQRNLMLGHSHDCVVCCMAAWEDVRWYLLSYRSCSQKQAHPGKWNGGT